MQWPLKKGIGLEKNESFSYPNRSQNAENFDTKMKNASYLVVK